MSLGEQLNDLDRKVLGASAVDRSRPAPPYEPTVGTLAPLGRSLAIRGSLYALGALAVGLHMLFGGQWKALLVSLVLVIVPALLLARLSTNAFPARFPDAPASALRPGAVSRSDRLALAIGVAAVCLLDLLLLSGKAQELLFVVAGLPAVLLFAVHGEVSEREQHGAVLASPARHRGRVGRGLYRVPTTAGGDDAPTSTDDA